MVFLMAWIHLTDPEDASGLLARIYKGALDRAGRVWNILRLQSPNPAQLRASMMMYTSVMHKDSALSPRLRETLAVVVSRANDCYY
jgi:alkylhydroperoxidase family enzyme